jgi:transposase
MKKISTVQIFESEIFKEQRLTIGMDLGDRSSCYCVLDEAGRILLEQKVAMTPEAMKQTFSKIPRSLIALETGTHSPWVSRLLTELGHEVIVAHAQKVQLITKSNRKDDRHDARTLARLARIDPELLGPVRHRSAQAQIHLTVIRARAELVRARTAMVNAARGLVKSYGQRLPKCGTRKVSRELGAGLPAELGEVLEPLLKEIESLNERIQEYDERMEKTAKESYPHVELLKQVKGVGTQIALTYVLTLDVVLHKVRVAFAADFLNQVSQQDVSGIAVTPFLARLEIKGLVAEARDELRRRCREGFELCVIREACEARDSGRVRQQVEDCDLIPRRRGVRHVFLH